ILKQIQAREPTHAYDLKEIADTYRNQGCDLASHHSQQLASRIDHDHHYDRGGGDRTAMQLWTAYTHKYTCDYDIEHIQEHHDGGDRQRSGTCDISKPIGDGKKGMSAQIDESNAWESQQNEPGSHFHKDAVDTLLILLDVGEGG